MTPPDDAMPNPELEDLVRRSLVELRKGPGKSQPYFDLVEAPHAVVPLLIAAFRVEEHRSTRALLVDAIWEHRLPAVLDFLVETLADPDPPVWQNALDGFVALGSREALSRLHAARRQLAESGQGGAERLEWIDESAAQIAEWLEPESA